MSTDMDRRARAAFDAMDREQVSDAIADMRALGFSEATIAMATRLSIEAVRQLLAERRERQ